MSEAIVETSVCGNCGVDRREGTAFCYNCGSALDTEVHAEPVAADDPDELSRNGHALDETEGKAALDALAAKLAEDGPAENDDKLSRAAEERKKARVSRRVPRSFTWEPEMDSRPMIMLIVALVATLITAGIVMLSLGWK